MKAVLLLLTIAASSLIVCQNLTKKNPTVKSYQFPKDSLYNAKVFTFCNQDNAESKMNVVHHVFSKNDTIYYLKYSLERTGRDSSIYIKSGDEFTKYTYKRFRKLLLSIYQKPMNDQKRILVEEIEQWRGENEQIDDICVIGIRV